ncbi:MAG: ankyrin repeat domain-containing protein [Candidatus Riflebacteria bacterium]|nr:ankyrin repeat domain-containing protein [Candidatus Riflebacteria bacterium]
MENKKNIKPEAVYEALENNDEELALRLLDEGAPVIYMNEENLTPLHLASKLGQARALRKLVALGHPVDAESLFEVTPLHLAAARRKPETFKILLEMGANYQKIERDGWTPLHWASFRGCAPIIEMLVSLDGCGLNMKDNDGWTPLHLAVAQEFPDRPVNPKAIEVLLKAGADPAIENDIEQTPMELLNELLEDAKEDVGLLAMKSLLEAA